MWRKNLYRNKREDSIRQGWPSCEPEAEHRENEQQQQQQQQNWAEPRKKKTHSDLSFKTESRKKASSGFYRSCLKKSSIHWGYVHCDNIQSPDEEENLTTATTDWPVINNNCATQLKCENKNNTVSLSLQLCSDWPIAPSKVSHWWPADRPQHRALTDRQTASGHMTVMSVRKWDQCI